MPYLDQLIGAMQKHGADAATIADGKRPALVIDGQSRPVSQRALRAEQVLRVLTEIAPPDQRDHVEAGAPTRFFYETVDVQVEVILESGPSATIRTAAAPKEEHPRPEPAATSTPPPEKAPPAPRVEVADGSKTLDIDGLLRDLVELGGSDLHMSSECVPQVRVHGDLSELRAYPCADKTGLRELLLSIAPERNREEFERRGDTDFAHTIEGLARFRVNLFRDRKGPGGVFRVIPSEIPSADKLAITPEVQELANLTRGLVLVTGPTGSGKSTTLAALVDRVNRTRPDHILTIEDPVEFVHENKRCLVNQREVGLHTESFKTALRAALREDPDVVLVGELRDLETVAIAIETAETGHLVFGTLHTNSAVSTVDRLIDQFPGDEQERIRVMLSESLRAVVAQVLLKKIGGGRVAAREILFVNAAVSNLIREGKTFQIPSMMQTGRKLGMMTLNDSLLDLVVNEQVEPAEAYFKATDKASLLSSYRNKNISTDFLRGSS